MSITLTRRGWGALAGLAILVASGRTLGLVELYVLAAGAGALTVLGGTYVATRRISLEASRELSPPRVHAGDDSRVELRIRNLRRRSSPLLTLRDALEGGPRQARFLLPPLAPGEVDRASYRLPADRRGVFTVGPLMVEWSDPFGLVRKSKAVAPTAELTVYPRVDVIRALPDSPGRDHHHTTPQAAAVGPSGEDFYALREYRHGDDLRRVHWPSTARRDQIMIRQDEIPWQGRATIVIDVRSSIHTSASFEVAVSAAASLFVASWQNGSVVRMVTTDGFDSGFGTGPRHVEPVLTRLSAVQGSSETLLASPAPSRSVQGAVAIVTTTAAGPEDLARTSGLASSPSAVTLVVIEGPTPFADSGSWPAVGRVVTVGGQSSFADAWQATTPSLGWRPRQAAGSP